jgi:hypothetical protein
MMNCREATRLMSESQERKLSVSDRLSLQLHVMMCSGCHNFKRQMGTIRTRTREYAKRRNEQDEKK